MAADGISVQTSIAQLGNAARAQAKGQQTQQSTVTFSEQLDKKEDLRVQRVQEADKAEKGRVGRDREDRRKKRRQRRERRNRRSAGDEENRTAAETAAATPMTVDADAAGPEATDVLGGLIDTRV